MANVDEIKKFKTQFYLFCIWSYFIYRWVIVSYLKPVQLRIVNNMLLNIVSWNCVFYVGKNFLKHRPLSRQLPFNTIFPHWNIRSSAININKLQYLERKPQQSQLVFTQVPYPGRERIWRCWFLWKEENRTPNPQIAPGMNQTQATLMGNARSHHCAISVPQPLFSARLGWNLRIQGYDLIELIIIARCLKIKFIILHNV